MSSTWAECRALVEGLRVVPFDEIGSTEWYQLHRSLHLLNKTAHQQALSKSTEFVGDLLVDHQKVADLIHLLIQQNLWKAQIFPKLRPQIAHLSSLRTYIPVFHEAQILNLLEIILYHDYALEAAGDTIVDLCDYCYTKLVWLVATPADQGLYGLSAVEDWQQIQEMSRTEHLKLDHNQVEFQCACTCISIIWFISTHVDRLPLTVATRLYDNLDVSMTLIPLLDKAPWIRTAKDGQKLLYQDNDWSPIHPHEAQTVSKLAGQIWLTLYSLVMDPKLSATYQINSARKSAFLGLRRHITDVLIDQIPPLQDMLRALETLNMSGNLHSGAGELHRKSATGAAFAIELVADILPDLEAEYSKKYDLIAERALKEYFIQETPEDFKLLATIIDEDEFLKAERPLKKEDRGCGHCGKKNVGMQCSKCKIASYCSSECQIQDWPHHRRTCREARA